MRKLVKILEPFGTHDVGDLIEVPEFVARFWSKNRMVEEVGEQPEVETRKIESAKMDYNIKGR